MNLWWQAEGIVREPGMGFPRGSDREGSACNVGDWVQSLDLEDPLKEGTATHSRIFAWRIPWTEEPDRSRGCKDSDKTERLSLGMDTYTMLYLKWITNKNLLYSTCNSAQCYMAAWMGEGSGGEWIHVYVWLSPFAIHWKLSQHC